MKMKIRSFMWILLVLVLCGCGRNDPSVTAETETSAPQESKEEKEEQKEHPEGEDIYMKYSSDRDRWVTEPDGTVLYGGKRYKRNSYIKAVLGIGVDRRGNLDAKNDIAENGQSDAVFLAVHDTARNRLKILMLQRDLFIPITKPDGKTVYDHLSLSWAFGDGAEQSAAVTRSAVERMLIGVPIDHYIAVDMELIGDIAETAGGITVTVPNDELAKKYPEWKRGEKVTLTKDTALKFLRYRDKGLDASPVFRMQQHRAFMLGFYSSLKKKAKQNSGVISDLYDVMSSHMITDMTKGEFLKLGLDGISTENLLSEDILSLPGTAVSATEDYPWDRVFLDYNGAIPMILDLFYREI